MDIADLNKAVSIDKVLHIKEGKGKLPFIEITNQYASATISLYGGQILSYKKHNSAELLFLSEKTFYEQGKAIKGGIPICWPWFGNDPENRGRPAHGFARNRLWELLDTRQLDNGATKVVMQLLDDEQSRKLWPHRFELTLTLIIGEQLSVALTTYNYDDRAFDITQALHTYFAVQSVDEVSIEGLEQNKYLDKAKSNKGEENKTQLDEVIFQSEVDRIYLDVPGELKLKQKTAHNVVIKTENNETAVVWNPGKILCEQSADLNDNDYLYFVCIETANAADNIIRIEAGESFTLSTVYELHD